MKHDFKIGLPVGPREPEVGAALTTVGAPEARRHLLAVHPGGGAVDALLVAVDFASRTQVLANTLMGLIL